MRAKILRASAGSGKTYRLAYKFVCDCIGYYPSKPYLYRAILAVTFTNKATEEMKSRILKEINDLVVCPEKSNYLKDLQRDLGLPKEEISRRARALRGKILHDYSRFTILTIDKFFQRILRAFVKELGIDLNYNIELDTASVLSRSTDSLIEQITSDEELQRWIMEFAEEGIELNMSWDINKELNALGHDIFKERSKQAIEDSVSKQTLREVIRSADQRSAKSKAEYRALAQKALDRMAETGVTPSDFHGKSRSFAHIFTHIAEESGKERIDSVRQWASSPEGWSKLESAQAIAPELCTLLQSIIKVYDENIKLWSSLRLMKRTYRSYALLQDIYRHVIEHCNEEGIMLLSETKYILSRFIEGNDAPFIYEKVGNRFERFMIDEFQDTSLKEWSNFIPLLRNAMSQAEDTSVLIVGDEKQSIYRWRGGDWRILQQGVSRDLGEQDTSTEFMQDNYRSLAKIVEFNNHTISRVVELDNNALNDELQSAATEGKIGEECYAELRDTLLKAYTSHEQRIRRDTSKQGYVRVERFDKQGPPPIVRYIASAIERGYSYKDILILCRSSLDGARIAQILLDYKRELGTFNIMTQDSLIVGSAPVSGFVIALMRLSQDIGDGISLAIVNDYLGRDYDTPPTPDEEQMLAHISQLSPEQAFEHIVATFSLGSRRDEVAYLQALHEQVVAFCSSKVADLQLFLREWNERGSERALSVEKSDDTIELLTIHKAKGLEKKVVIIPYCNWSLTPRTQGNVVWAKPETSDEELASMGCFPVDYSQQMTPSIFSEEYFRELTYSHVDSVNLLYVALTRAQEELYVCIPNQSNSQNIGSLLWRAIEHQAQGEEPTQWVEWGECDDPEPSSDHGKGTISNLLIDAYPTTSSQMNLRLSEQRYFDEGSERRLSARNMGIVLHSAISEATSAEDIVRRIESLRLGGSLSDEQATHLRSAIERGFEREEVREWFSEWDEVRCENDILGPHITGTRRPDRVMIRGKRAVVVDYKFGEEKSSSHKRQVARYMDLLREMGYTPIEGWIWYLTLDEIVKIEN